MQAKFKRNIQEGKQYNGYFREPTYEDKLIEKSVDTEGTVRFLQDIPRK